MHPATLIPFKTLIQELNEETVKGYITKKINGSLTLYNYTNKCTFAKKWNRATLVARGLVVSNEQIVAYPFPKFFNHTEVETVPSFDQINITEKMDGSLGIIFYANDEWHVVTRGSFISKQSAWAKKRLPLASMIMGVTYLVEIIYPENKVVIQYDEEKLVLLGAYSADGNEILDLASLNSDFSLVSFYHFNSKESILAACHQLPSDKEGYVVRFFDGYRLKFKGAKYLELHRKKSDITPKKIWEDLRSCNDLKSTIPEEFYDEYDKIQNEYNEQYMLTVNKINTLLKHVEKMDNKEVSISTSLTKQEKFLIFLGRRPNFDERNVPGKVRNDIFEQFKPK